MLCLCRNQQTGQCNPSNQQLLGMFEDMPRRTFFTAKQELIKRGWLTNLRDEYQLLRGFSVQNPTKTSAENGTDEVPKTALASAENGTKLVPKTALESAENGTPYIGRTDKEQTSGTEGETLSPDHSPELLALCVLLQSGDPELLSSLGHENVKALESVLKTQRQAGLGEIQEFTRRWYAEDWRGRKGQPPTARQVQDEWAKVMAKRPMPTESPPRNPDCPKCDKDGWRWRDWPAKTGQMVKCECRTRETDEPRTRTNQAGNGTLARH